MQKNTVTTTVQKREEYFVQFTPEQMETLGITPGDKFEVLLGEENTVTLKKMANLELDLESFDKDLLIALINLSVEDQVPVDEVIRKLLEGYLELRRSELSAEK
jgi:hypothetical protein